MNEVRGHSHTEEYFKQFAELDLLLTNILFASSIAGSRGINKVVDTHRSELSQAAEWMRVFFRATLHGWFIRQRAENFSRLEEESILQVSESELKKNVSPYAQLGIVDLDVGEEMSTPQQMSLITIGLLHQLKSVTYQDLNKAAQLGNDRGLSTTSSYWMFNWNPESLFRQLKWLQGTAQHVLTDPAEMAEQYAFQLIRFGHFVSAFLQATQARSAQLKRLEKRKEARPTHALQVYVPPGADIFSDTKTTQTYVSDFVGTERIPDSFSDFIRGLDDLE